MSFFGSIAQQAMIGGSPTPPPTVEVAFVGGKIVAMDTTDVAPWTGFDFTSLSGGIASAPSVGDYFIICAALGDPGSSAAIAFDSAPAGANATPIASNYRGGSRDCRIDAWDGIYEAGSATGGSFISRGGIDGAIAIMVFRGVSQLDVAASTAQGSRPSNLNCPPTIPISANAPIVCFGAAGRINQSSGPINEPIADMEQFFQASSAVEITMGAGMTLAHTAGEFNPVAWTGMNTTLNDQWCAFTFALRPD